MGRVILFFPEARESNNGLSTIYLTSAGIYVRLRPPEAHSRRLDPIRRNEHKITIAGHVDAIWHRSQTRGLDFPIPAIRLPRHAWIWGFPISPLTHAARVVKNALSALNVLRCEATLYRRGASPYRLGQLF